MSSKNRLQEIYQKQNQMLPIYNTTQVDGMWISEAITTDGIKTKSDPQARKTLAECDVADKVLKLLETVNASDAESPSESSQRLSLSDVFSSISVHEKLHNKTPTYVLVDYENVNKLFKLQSCSQYSVIRVVSYVNQKASTGEADVVINSCGSDSVDHYISALVGRLIQEHVYHQENLEWLKIIILTRDRFAAAHLQMWQDQRKVKIYHSVTEQAVLDLVSTDS